MILISHRGNINGSNEIRENSTYYIIEALELGFDVEIDIWNIESELFLGHSCPQYKIEFNWIVEKSNRFWIHCKNKQAIEYFIQNKNKCSSINWFWHENDMVTLTSLGYVWAYPGKQPIKNSIAVMPELKNDNINECIGICSDYILKYKK